MRTYLLSAIVLCVLMSVSAFAQDGKLADPATRPDLSFPPAIFTCIPFAPTAA